jgi:hypothetical protein
MHISGTVLFLEIQKIMTRVSGTVLFLEKQIMT